MDTINLNIGLLGHVDAGKTTLARVLSETASTAAFDKNPQSQDRGITLDLGFSSTTVDLDTTDNIFQQGIKHLQFTFVDCPGHASLIRTIIGGVQIIDLMILVIDVNKGIQTQTSECLIMAEIMRKKLIVVLNKIDMIEPPQKQEDIINKSKIRISKILSEVIPYNIEIVEISAKNNINIDRVRELLRKCACVPDRQIDLPFTFAVDHCFPIKGQGTVCTGTVLQGQLHTGDKVEFPVFKETRKVKSIQMFRKSIKTIRQGDRAGICFTQFDSNQMERGILSAPGYLTQQYAFVILFNKIKYYRNAVQSNKKFHISIGHETALGVVTLFGSDSQSFSCNLEYEYLPEIPVDNNKKGIFALIELEIPVIAPPNALIIGSKLDMDINSKACRLAFWGNILQSFPQKDYKSMILPQLKIFKIKERIGKIQRVICENEVISANLFKKESDREIFLGLSVILSTGERGKIDSTFGKSSKVKIRLFDPIKPDTINLKEVTIKLEFKKYIFTKDKKIYQ